MKIIIIFVLTVVASFCTAQQPLNIIPQPVSIQQQSGDFVLTVNTAIKYNSQQKDLKNAVNFFNQQIRNITGFVLPVNTSQPTAIQLSIEKLATIGDEGYKLDITTKGIAIKANTTAGIIYGIQSLLQTLPAIRTNATLEIPCMSITDYPRFKYRGMHLDVSRHFFGSELIKEYIDLIASYKMNVFHWHLVDDQGWRIEIKKYPKLTSVGAWRVDQTDKIWASRPQAKPGEKPTYGGYYTQEQIKTWRR